MDILLVYWIYCWVPFPIVDILRGMGLYALKAPPFSRKPVI